MNWEETLKNELMNSVQMDYEHLYRICHDAYKEGCGYEKSLAVEAYRLRCSYLFGNRCMMASDTIPRHIKVCDGNCSYLHKYEFELYKLEVDLDQQIKDCFMLVNTKVGFAIWFIGLVLALKPAFRIWNLDAPKKRKLIVGVLIILTSGPNIDIRFCRFPDETVFGP